MESTEHWMGESGGHCDLISHDCRNHSFPLDSFRVENKRNIVLLWTIDEFTVWTDNSISKCLRRMIWTIMYKFLVFYFSFVWNLFTDLFEKAYCSKSVKIVKFVHRLFEFTVLTDNSISKCLRRMIWTIMYKFLVFYFSFVWNLQPR